MQAKTKNTIVDITCFLFIVLFVYASISKLIDYQKFRVQIGQSPILTSFGGLITWMVPALEIVLSVLLAVSRFRMQALYGSFTLMVLFTAYIVAITRFSEYIPCSCGGILEGMGWGTHLAFNLCFTALASVAIILYQPLKKIP